MLKLQAALCARWDSTAGATIRALANAFVFRDDAASQTATPYVTFEYMGAGTTGSMTGDHSQVMVTFTIWVDHGQLAVGYAIRSALIALFDRFMPSFTGGGNVISARRDDAGTPIVNPDEGYAITVSYLYIFTD